MTLPWRKDSPAQPNEADIADLLQRFDAAKLEPARWTHLAHLAVGAALIRRLGYLDACRAIPGRIWRLNEASGVPNSDTRGYHHTVTMAFLWGVSRALAAQPADLPLAQLVERMAGTALATKQFPLAHYGFERLWSAEARRGWVAPDLAPMDGVDAATAAVFVAAAPERAQAAA
ncbi:MAG: hypothetical protein JNK11_04270 [Alphaproteobacteria bacterium]|nr:hypothetical protein [Alphaproteobacteria bacterium]